MGYWDETCAITRQPIFVNDPCVMVTIDPKAQGDTLSGNLAFTSPQEFTAVKKITHGTYNDYGWLEELDAPTKAETQLCLVFFHDSVWKSCVQYERKSDDVDAAWIKSAAWDRLMKTEDPPEGIEDFILVAMFAYAIRQSIVSAWDFRGCQDHTEDRWGVLRETIDGQVARRAAWDAEGKV